MSVQVIPANGDVVTAEELRVAQAAAEHAVSRVRALRQRQCERCAADVEAVVAARRPMLVDAAPVIPAMSMDGLVLWTNPSTHAVEHVRAGNGEALYREHRCDSGLTVVEQPFPVQAMRP
jgi:hypothetical protein